MNRRTNQADALAPHELAPADVEYLPELRQILEREMVAILADAAAIRKHRIHGCFPRWPRRSPRSVAIRPGEGRRGMSEVQKKPAGRTAGRQRKLSIHSVHNYIQSFKRLDTCEKIDFIAASGTYIATAALVALAFGGRL